MTTRNPYDDFPKLPSQKEVVRYYDTRDWIEEKFPQVKPSLRDYLSMSERELEEAKEMIQEALIFKKMGS